MIKNILIYRWNSNSEQAVIHNLEEMGYHCIQLNDRFTDYHSDAVFAQKVMEVIQKEKIEMVFSWDYFPLLASVCGIGRLPYVSWIYDCPLYTLLSKTVLYQHNYLFCFDRIYAERLAALGCRNVYHFPLGVDIERFEDVICRERDNSSQYTSDVSFVGSMYTDKNKWLEAENIPEYVKGYLNGIMEAQLRVYGYNFVKDMVEENVARDILKKADLSMGEMYFDEPVQQIADFVNEEITRREREGVLETIARKHPVRLYTNSAYHGNDNIRVCDPVDYQSQMPLVFRNSRINLNITSRTIESGIPLRVLDILACGGFCLTNYQPEIAEFFEDGVELVMYTSMEDMANKVDWYLQHEEERAAIAAAGCRKVKESFSMRNRLADMLAIVEEEIG